MDPAIVGGRPFFGGFFKALISGCILATLSFILASFGSLLAPFWLLLGSPLAPLGSILAPFWVPFGSLLAPFWFPFGSFGCLLATFWLIWLSFGFLLARAVCGCLLFDSLFA